MATSSDYDELMHLTIWDVLTTARSNEFPISRAIANSTKAKILDFITEKTPDSVLAILWLAASTSVWRSS